MRVIGFPCTYHGSGDTRFRSTMEAGDPSPPGEWDDTETRSEPCPGAHSLHSPILCISLGTSRTLSPACFLHKPEGEERSFGNCQGCFLARAMAATSCCFDILLRPAICSACACS